MQEYFGTIYFDYGGPFEFARFTIQVEQMDKGWPVCRENVERTIERMLGRADSVTLVLYISFQRPI